MKKKSKKSIESEGNLFSRVVTILEQARTNVIRTVNNEMVLAYWQIGREIVQSVQSGDKRAGYGKQVIKELSKELNKKYGKGFSTTNLWYFRQFYLVYSDREPRIRHKACGELNSGEKLHKACGVSNDLSMVVEKCEDIKGFSPLLSWSHYRTLSKVEQKNERLFYEIEAEKEGWSVPALQRQIDSFLFPRLLKSRDKDGVMELVEKGQLIKTPSDSIKDPYILDFLGLPDFKQIHESKLETAIIDNLQSFLLELGKGFAFVARQKRLQYEDEYFYIDLVFYNCILKCYLLIDLKIGKLTHQDIGQMDSYIRMYDDKYFTEGDNPSIGLILCAKKNETIARYSVLKDSKQLFASKYMLCLPTEEELQQELERERILIEKLQSEGKDDHE
ncbi:MAG: PDDEXK nuclease domain-containing protein [Candidatus Krumholzibacteriota bacterium]|nr:PDDEXK nuclease domain-containing protein [Candidatus Krumholzibacteriota bacterium]